MLTIKILRTDQGIWEVFSSVGSIDVVEENEERRGKLRHNSSYIRIQAVPGTPATRAQAMKFLRALLTIEPTTTTGRMFVDISVTNGTDTCVVRYLVGTNAANKSLLDLAIIGGATSVTITATNGRCDLQISNVINVENQPTSWGT